MRQPAQNEAKGSIPLANQEITALRCASFAIMVMNHSVVYVSSVGRRKNKNPPTLSFGDTEQGGGWFKLERKF